MTAEELAEVIEEAGYETRRYSGRGMYGKKCVGFEVEHGNEYKAIIEILLTYMDTDIATGEDSSKYPTPKEIEELREILGGVNKDEMGRDSYILYFPRIKYVEEQ